MKELEQDVLKWAKEKGILSADNIEKQTVKLSEEVGELNGAMLKNDTEAAKMELGDNLVVICIMAKQAGYDIEYCIEFSLYDNVMSNNNLALSVVTGQIAHEVDLAVFSGQLVAEYMGVMLDILTDIATELNTTLEYCLQLAYDKISKRKGKTINGTFIKE